MYHEARIRPLFKAGWLKSSERRDFDTIEDSISKVFRFSLKQKDSNTKVISILSVFANVRVLAALKQLRIEFAEKLTTTKALRDGVMIDMLLLEVKQLIVLIAF